MAEQSTEGINGKRLHPLSVLIVEDDEPVRRSLVDFLADRYARVAEAANGKEALDRLIKDRFDAVISDIRMPHLDGVGLLREIEKRFPTVSTILVTGYADIETAVAASRHHAFDYIRKPYDLAQVDATPRKLLEKRRMEREQEAARQRKFARERFLALGTLTSSLLHEINNPNAVILGNAQLLRARFYEPVAASDLAPRIDEVAVHGLAFMANSLEAIRVASARIDDLVRRVHSIAAGKSDSPRRAGIAEVTRGEVSRLAEQGRAQITFACSESADSFNVAAYPEEVRQVVTCLVENAIDSASSAPAPEVRVHIGISDDPGMAEMRVEDNGPGIAPGLETRVFDPFVTTKRDRPGRGLGLYITRQIIEQIGGTIAAQPGEDGGAAFIVHWPRWKETL